MDASNIIISLLTLTLLEIVLGVDNLVFIAIASNRLPQAKQKSARRFGLMLAWVTRLLLLASAVWIASLTQPLFTLFHFAASGRDLLLFSGGLFLLAKGTHEIHTEMDSIEEGEGVPKKHATMLAVVIQIALFDIVFSFDSVITAVGLTPHFWVMATAITIAIIVMIVASEPLAAFINKHPSIKMLALSFLLLIGTVLMADGLHFHIPRGYIYFALVFSILVEALNFVKIRKQKTSS